MAASGRIVLLVITGITAVAALFCVIGLATKGWAGGMGLFQDGVHTKAPAGLSIISFILLIVTVISFVLLMFDILKGALAFIPIGLLFIATIFLLATFTSYVTDGLGYSFDLIVVAHFFSYVALATAAYWYGRNDMSTSSG